MKLKRQPEGGCGVALRQLSPSGEILFGENFFLMPLFRLSPLRLSPLRFSPAPRRRARFALQGALLLATAWLSPFTSSALAQSTPAQNLAMGNPSGATNDTGNPNNYLLVKPQYTFSYNKSHATPNWVSWHLSSADIGTASRSENFFTDTTLPSGWYRVTNGDYTGSGYDRGHNCPSADRTLTEANNDATFFMTNIVPQQADNNQGPWAKLETYCRTLIDAGNELFIISAPSSYNRTTIASGKVYVPRYMSKVIVVLPKGSSTDASSVKTTTRVICVDMPNVTGIRSASWQSYRTSVDKVEAATGLNFLSNVDPSIQAVIEARVDNG